MRTGGDPKYNHLNEELHLSIEVVAHPSDAHIRMSHALAEVAKYMSAVSAIITWKNLIIFEQV